MAVCYIVHVPTYIGFMGLCKNEIYRICTNDHDFNSHYE